MTYRCWCNTACVASAASWGERSARSPRRRRSAWPGNVRELQSVLKQALLRASGTLLLPAFLPELTARTGVPAAPSPRSGENPALEAFIGQRLRPETQDLYAQAQRELDRILLPRVLGIAPKTLRQKLRELGLNTPPAADGDDDDRP